jgi:hypothetical protein
MPIISRFYGILILMFHNDHLPPHFHVKYAEYGAQMTIDTLEVYKGQLPRRVMALVLEWAALHRSELWKNWHRAREGLPPEQIEPLE